MPTILKCGGKAKIHKKKMFIGGAMAVANIGMDALSAIQGRIDARNAESVSRNANIRSEYLMDKEQLKNMNTTGSPTTMFANGGKDRVTTKSGLFGKAPNTSSGLAKVSGNIYKVLGAKHENGGTDIAPNIEAERGEYAKFKDGMVEVISDRDIQGTIPADEFEGKLGSKSADAAFSETYAKQESMKKDKMGCGGKKKMARIGGGFKIDPNVGENAKDIEALYGTVVPEATIIAKAGSPRLLPQVNAYAKRTYPVGENAKDIEALNQTILPEATIYGNKSYPSGENANDVAALNSIRAPRSLKPIIDMTAGQDTSSLYPEVSNKPKEYTTNVVGNNAPTGFGLVDDASSIAAKANLLPKTSKLDGVGQFMDNAGNLLLTLAKPKVPTPIYSKPISLNTEVNVNPQLSEIQRTAANLRTGIRGNFANPITSSALEQKVDTNALMQKNTILGTKQAQEQELKNRETMINQQVNMQNQELANQYNANVMGRTQEKFGELSQNMANVQDDITNKDNIQKLTDYQDKQLYTELLTDVEGKNANAVAAGLFDSVLSKLSKADFDKLNIPIRLRTAINAKLIK